MIRARSRVAATSAAIALLVGGCGSASSPPAATPIASAGGDMATDALAAALADASWTALASVGQDTDAAVGTATGHVELVGGGTADWLMARRSEGVAAALDAAGVDSSGIGSTGISREPIAQEGPGIAMTWIGATVGVPFIMSTLTGRIGESIDVDGEPRTSHDDTTIDGRRTVAETTVTISSRLSGASVIVDGEVVQSSTTTDAAGATVWAGTYRSRVRAELEACPDADGVVSLQMEIELSATSTSGGGSFALQAQSVLEGQVGEDAFLQSTTLEIDHSQEVTDRDGNRTTGSGQRAVSIAERPNGGGFDSVTGASGSVGDGTMDASESIRWGNFVQMTTAIVSSLAFQDAQKVWRGGKCVRIEADEHTRDVESLDTIPFTATVMHAIDGNELDKPIIALLNGAQSILPEGTAQPSPASLTYIAGVEIGETGKVDLTSTSNRGIGTLAITFTVASSVVLELEIDSTVTPEILNGLAVIDGRATARGRIRLSEASPDNWRGNGSLASRTTSSAGGCQTMTITGQGSYDWQVRNVLAGPDIPASDIVVDIDSGSIAEQPDTFTARTCPVPVTGTMNTWENLFFSVYNDRKNVNGLRVTGWTLNATADTWITGGLVATATWSGMCPAMVLPGAPGEDDLAIPGFLECQDRTTFRLWAVLEP